MAGTTLLVPIRFPVTRPTRRTLVRAVDLACQSVDAHLFVLHVNLIQEGENVARTELQAAVEDAIGRLSNASYHVRDAFLIEEAILNEACNQDADYVVIGHSLRARWRRILSARLGVAVDVEAFLRQHLDAELVVI